MARAVRKTFSDIGTFLSSTDRMHTAKAMSVAVGIPQPLAAAVPWLMMMYMSAGAITPPNAAMTGSMAFFTLESSPWATSLRISKPTVKKNITIRMSLMNFSTVRSLGNRRSRPPSGLERCTCIVVSRTS